MGWQRQEGETSKQYELFCKYLKMPRRSIEKLANEVKLSAVYIRRIAAEKQWRDRAAEYDESCLETAREEVRRLVAEGLVKQYEMYQSLQAKAASELLQRDMSKASFKSLNEIVATAGTGIFKIAEALKVFEDSAQVDKNVTIHIIGAEKHAE